MVDYATDQWLQVVDWQSMARAIGVNGVLTGLQVSPVSGMNISVAAGEALINGKKIIKSSSTELAVPAANANYPRKDIVVLNDSGTLSVVSGSPEAIYPDPDKVGIYTPIPRPPSLPTNSIILAEIWVPAGATSIGSENIYDKRHIVVDKILSIECRTSDPTGSELWDGRIWLRTDL